MAHLSALLTKNWILWKRNCFWSCCELILPLLLIFALMGIRSAVPKETINELSYLFPDQIPPNDKQFVPLPIYWGINETAINEKLNQQITDPTIQALSVQEKLQGINDTDTRLKFLPQMKNCIDNVIEERRWQNGLVALGPSTNSIVLKLQSIFEDYYQYPTKMFETNEEIDDYVRSSDYGNDNKERLCFAVIFNNKFEYSLRFNASSLNGEEIPSTNQDAVDPVIQEDQQTSILYFESGMLTVQNFIDNLIIQQETNEDTINISPYFSFIRRAAGVKDDFGTFLKGQFGIYLVLPLIIIYLRMTYAIINEKEKKLREGMKMMGLNNTSFYLSWIIQYMIIYTLISIIATILLKIAIFPNTNGVIIFIIYWLFCLVLIAQSMFISVFFTKALFGLIVSIVWYLMMYLVITLVGSSSVIPTSTYWGASISSHAGFSFACDLMITYEVQGKGVTFSDLGTNINNYNLNIAIVMFILNIAFYMILAIYLDLVFPNEWGKKKHPLFFIPYFNKRHQVNVLQRQKSTHDRYEDVEQALIDQESRNEVLKIQDLNKIYPNGKVAVNNVNLTIYTSQIFALLGHNGAGKTSLLSMLTGLLDITHGSATAFGLDVETQIEEIRTSMGVCPQHDILFDSLTVKEHLEMFAIFKGMKNDDIPPAVRRIIEDVDLLDKTDYLAKNLSGGQKRRLSVAIAFIGNSKLIYLDEPTSGMDTSARRYIWEMLKNYKEDRIIVLTTHFMDEADFLGDRIGIMGEGKLICHGSSVFLKNKFGSGYNMTIVKESNVDAQPILDLVTTKCPEATLLSNVSAEILFQLPIAAISKFPSLFEEIDKSLENLKIMNYGISITTLEEVFLKVSEVGAGHKQVKDVQNEENEHLLEIDDVDMNKIRIVSSIQLFINHTIALLLKRIRYFKRDIRSLCCEVFLPCVVVLAGLALMTIQFIYDNPGIELIPSLYNFNVEYSHTGINDATIYQNIPFEPKDLMTFSGQLTSTQLSEFDLNYFKNYNRLHNIGWYYLMEDEPKRYQYAFFSNTIFSYGPITLMNQMNSAIFQKLTNTNQQIKVWNKPFVNTDEEMNQQNTVSAFVAALVFSIGMAFIPASVISYIVKEREINIKHQQLVSGVSVKAYWFSNWLMDVGKHIIPSIICCLLILAFDITIMIDDGNYGVMWLLFFLYGWAIVPFCYLFSFAFKAQGNAMLVNFFIHLMTGSIISLVIFVLRLIKSTRSIAKTLHWILRFIPSFSFAYGIVNACSKNTYKVLEGYSTVKSTYDIDISGADILYLALEGLFYTILVFILEYFEDNGQMQKLGSREATIPYVPNQDIDDDVMKEQELCATVDPETKAIVVKDMRKVFILSKNNHKVAVDQISFAIDNGEVFGLLGVNGAGKTTTFKILSGELKPTSGQAWVAGKSVITDLEAARVNIGYCPQFDALLENLTVREHLELFSDVKGIPIESKEELVIKKLKEMDLLRFEHIQSGQLSGGNKRKLSVAIAMMGNPPIVFLDEPSTGMDPEARRFMWNVISRIATQRKQSTIILTTHSMEEAEALSTRIAIQVDGNLRCLGSVQHIKSKFGKGYELEIKMEKPSHQTILEIIEKVGSQPTTRLNQEQMQLILKKANAEQLENSINMRGFGSHIYNDLRKANGLAIETLAEFIIIEEMGNKLQQFIEIQLGNYEIIEHFSSFYRFRLTANITVGKIFSGFETNKNQLQISQYSIKQASIEQIFNNFANPTSDKVQVVVPND